MKTATRILAALVLGLAAAGAQAQAYVFGAFSYTVASTRLAPDHAEANVATLQLGAGYQVLERLGLEAFYLQTGHYDGMKPALGDWNATAYGLALAGNLELAPAWRLVGKAGAAWTETEVLRRRNPGPGNDVLRNDLGALPYLAAGVQYLVNENLRAALLYQTIRGPSSSELERLDLLSLAVSVHF